MAIACQHRQTKDYSRADRPGIRRTFRQCVGISGDFLEDAMPISIRFKNAKLLIINGFQQFLQWRTVLALNMPSQDLL